MWQLLLNVTHITLGEKKKSHSLVSSQVVLGGVGGEGVGILVVGVLAAVVSGRLSGQGDARVVVRVDGLAEVDGVLELLLEHLLAGVTRQLEQEEAGVRLGQEMVRRVVLVQNLTRSERDTPGQHMPSFSRCLCRHG